MKIAIVGAGLYGSVIALELSNKHNINLFEKKKDIMQCASGINQFRLHGGYHYPRSVETLKEIQSSLISFNNYFHDSIFVNSDNYYAVAKKDSKTSKEEFEKFCKDNDLFYENAKLKFINYNNIDESYKVEEKIINPVLLKNEVNQRLNKSKVNLHLNSNFDYEHLKLNHDMVILCTYGHDYMIDNISINLTYKYQLVEKILLDISNFDQSNSLVVIDGPFFLH